MITKDRDELFHRVEQRNLPNEGGSVLVQVHTCTYSGEVRLLPFDITIIRRGSGSDQGAGAPPSKLI